MSGEDETREYSTVDLRKNLGQALGRAHFQGEVVIISNHGRPYAGLVSDKDAKFLKKIEPVKQLILDKLEDGHDLSELLSGVDNPVEPNTDTDSISVEDSAELREPIKRLMTQGMSIKDIVAILEEKDATRGEEIDHGAKRSAAVA